MPRLDFADKNLNNATLPKIKDAITYINKALNNIPNGPDGFEKYRALTCRDTLKNVKKGLTNKSDNLKKIMNKIIKEEQQQTKIVSVLSINRIKARSNKNVE